MSYIIHVLTQYSENYGDSVNPHWKAKNGVSFKMNISSDERMYYERDEIEAAVKAVIAKECNPMANYEVIDISIESADVKNLTAAFKAQLAENYQAANHAAMLEDSQN